MGASSPVVFETERLAFREMNQDDFLDLAEMLQNPKVMYAYEHDFSNSDVQQWLDRQIGRYRDYGFGLWAVISKTSGVMVGQAGLTMQPYRNKDVLEIGYLLKKEFWHCGYAREAAEGCKRYAFEQLKRVISFLFCGFAAAYFIRTFFSLAKRGRESSLGSLGSPWIRGST